MHERQEKRAKLSLESLLGDFSSDDERSAQPRERLQHEAEEQLER